MGKPFVQNGVLHCKDIAQNSLNFRTLSKPSEFQHDKGESDCAITGVRSSSRRRVYTEKGLEYTLELHVRQFKKAVADHIRQIHKCKTIIASGKHEVLEFTDLRNDLENCIVAVSNAFHKLIETDSSKFDQFVGQINECESANRAALHDITGVLRSFENQGVPSCQSRSTTGHKVHCKSKSHPSCKSSSCSRSRSNCSSQSRRSSKSTAALKAEAAANAAALRMKLKYLDAETAQRANLDKLRTMRDLEIEEAKLSAINDVHVSPVEFSQIPNNTFSGPLVPSVCHVDSSQITQTRQPDGIVSAVNWQSINETQCGINSRDRQNVACTPGPIVSVADSLNVCKSLVATCATKHSAINPVSSSLKTESNRIANEGFAKVSFDHVVDAHRDPIPSVLVSTKNSCIGVDGVNHRKAPLLNCSVFGHATCCIFSK